MKVCTIAIDVGTGSLRSALVDDKGRILHIEAQEYDQIVPAHGWSEQRPSDWWSAASKTLMSIMAWARANHIKVEAVAACGQMHGTVLLDDDGDLTRETVPLWNDKRTLNYVRDFERSEHSTSWLARTANPPTPAWPGFKLMWLRDNDTAAWARTASVMMPKDYINFRLTGERAMDWTEAACSFFMDPKTGDWSSEVIKRLGIEASHLLPIRQPSEILGFVSREAALMTGLPSGTPVLVGGGDYPVALLGSGVCRPGMASEVSGSSSILTLVVDKPILDAEVSNVGTPEGNWGSFVLLEAGGDSARWARRVFHDGAKSYAEIVEQAAATPAGARGLFFLPYLVGERLGAHRNSRAQFFGLSAGHGPTDMDRAVFEGVGFAVNRHLRIMERATGEKPEVFVASGGGAKADLWLKIRASIYNRRILIPEELECGLIGCAALTSVATGKDKDLVAATNRLIRYTGEVKPNLKWVDHYSRMQPIFDDIYDSSQKFYDRLDALNSAGGEGLPQ